MIEKAFDVCVVGSANLDLVTTVDHLVRPGETILARGYQEHPGGKGLNQAVACSRMGARTAFVGCVGQDAAGAQLMEVMAREKINTDAVARGDEPAGRAFISVDANGENNIIVVPGSNANLKAGHGVEIVENSKVVLAQLEIPLEVVITAFASARRAGALTVLNPAPVRDLPDELLELCDYVVPNQVEAQHIGGVARCLALGVKAVITTLGANGVQIDSAVGSEKIGAIQVTAVDTTAAGDAFLGGFCSSLASGAAINEAVRVGAIAGAVAVTREGAVPSLPNADEVQARRSELSS